MHRHSRNLIYVTLPIIFVLIRFVFFLLMPQLDLERNIRLLLVCVNLLLDVITLGLVVVFIRTTVNVSRRTMRYEQQAYTDAMTQVRNRAAFDLVFERLTPTACPNLTLIMTDMNNLKQVNDTLGHPAGDKLIRSLVHYLEDSFGSLGSIYRYGGDEFVLLIENAPLETVQAARAKFDAAILEHSAHGGIEISVAIGMASRQDPLNAQLHTAELLSLADMAMYQYKATQKNTLSAFQTTHHQRTEQIDAATGILTFAAFKAHIYDSLAHKTIPSPFIVNFDLNFFDGYNTLFGWDAGNEILQRLTTLALNLCGKNGFCGHGDADSFWVLADFDKLEDLTAKITYETARFQSELDEFLLFPSFGIYCINDSFAPISDMCSHATNAKREIKGYLDTLYKVYSAEDHQRRIASLHLTASLRHALENDEFIPYFQPQYSPDGKQLVGAEALARWQQGNGMFSTPEEFAELYEKSGLILSLDWHILKKTCAFLRRQLDNGISCVPISVNFSRLHVYEKDCAERICQLTDEYNLPHHLIQIELTESALVQRVESISTMISALRSNNFSVVLDNFGRGFSSLALLRHIQVDMIKVDQSLTSGVLSSECDIPILAGISELSHRLKIIAVAKGLETESQIIALLPCGFDVFQGRYYAPAMPESEFEKLLHSSQQSIGKISLS